MASFTISLMSVALYKVIGFLITILLIAGIYWISPEYAKARYDPVWNILIPVFSIVLVFSYPYIKWVDNKKGDLLDGYYYSGLFFTGQWNELDWLCLKRYFLGWLVKGFFLPLMLASLFVQWEVISSLEFTIKNFNSLYIAAISSIYLLDVAVGSLGYLCTLRMFNAEIKSVDMSFLGWFAALSCYPPFSQVFGGAYYGYESDLTWNEWLHPYPVVYITWAFLIIGLHVIYVSATCSFGIRFSNLTNRGIITRGPYRYLKHPAYVSKNIAWWLMQVPFVMHASFLDSLRACICLLVINGIYVLRAYTEEKHLMSDPEYVKYSSWMSQHGLFAKFKFQLIK